MEEYVQQALEIVKAQASVRTMSEEEITSMVQSLSKQLKDIVEGTESAQESEQTQEPAVDPKKAIREKAVVCLECGKKFKVLSKKHLAQHGLTPEEYKEKWGYKKNTSLIAKALARQRKQKMQEMQLWKRRTTS
ncbi:MucR family transcriptional regulator [Desulfovermiculus halophilus]|jgi:predicted transcriptional regulator|uniref:MucR family transcriptional regulator n=1 Tax=Desulfovermiculus halophilus TaxID=339722 RepID=UPI0004802D87|nr:MucR family transcriptional regulator [Desulfovermiculus halophilus]